MSGFLLVRTDGAFVSRPGSRSSYTRDLLLARIYPTRDQADADRCPGNERIIPVDALFDPRQ